MADKVSSQSLSDLIAPKGGDSLATDFPDKIATDFPDKPKAKSGSFLEDLKAFPASVLSDPRTSMATIPLGGQAAGLLAKGGPALLQKIAPLLGRLATAGGIKSGEAATKGQSPLGGAIKGAAGEAVGEAIPPVLSRALGVVARPLVSKAAKSAQEAAQRATEASQTDAVAKGLGQVLPELKSTGEGLFDLVRGGKGKDAMDEVFKTAKSAAEARLGGKKLSIPGFSDEPMSLDEALRALQESGKGIGQQVGLARSEGAKQASMRYGEAREAVIGALKRIDPGAAQIMDAALARYRQGRGVLAALDKSFDRSGNLDPSKLLSTVNQRTEKLMRSSGPNWKYIESALTGGQKVPVNVPPVTPFEPRGRLETILKGPQAPGVEIGGRKFPVVPPKGAQEAAGAVGGSFPVQTLGAGAGLTDWLKRLNPLAEHRGPFSSRRE